MRLVLCVAVVPPVLPLLLASYIPAATYSGGYLPAPSSTRPIETTTPRLTYGRIYASAAQHHASTKTDRSDRASAYRIYRAVTKSDRTDRSDTYHTGSGDVCGDFQTIGLGAGAASLLAFLVYILLTNSLTSTVATTATTARRAGADPWLARATVTATCTAADLLDSRRSGETPWRNEPASGDSSSWHGVKSGAEESDRPSSLLVGPPQARASGLSRASSLRESPRESVAELSAKSAGGSSPLGSPRESAVAPRQFGDDCFSEMIGALAGLAGLGALSGFSLSQSAQALLTSMMTISALTTTTTTTTTTTGTDGNTGAARRLTDMVDQTGLSLASRMASLAVTSGDLACVQRDLCRLVRSGRQAGRPYDTALPLASLPFSWLLSKRSGHRFSDLCWVIQESEGSGDCADLYPSCDK